MQPPAPESDAQSMLLGALARNASLAWLGLYLARLVLLPQAGVGASSVLTFLVSAGLVGLALAVGSAWAAAPRRQLGLIGLACALTTALQLRNSWLAGYFVLWNWPLWALGCAVTAMAAQRVWPAQWRRVHGVAAVLLLVLLGWASVVLWLGPAGGRELQWLLRAWMSALGTYGVVCLWLWGSAGRIPMARLRLQAMAGLMALHFLLFFLSYHLSAEAPLWSTRYMTRSSPVAMSNVAGQAILLLVLIVPAWQRYFVSLAIGLSLATLSVATWGNGTVVLPLLGIAAVALAQLPVRRRPWAAAAWTVLMAALATSPRMEHGPALMHGLTATAMLLLLLWLAGRLEGMERAAGGGTAPQPLPEGPPLATADPALLRRAVRAGLATGLAALAVGALALAAWHQGQQAAERTLAQAAAQGVSGAVARRLQRAEHAAQAMAQLDPRTLDDELAFVRHASHLVGMLGPSISLQWAPQGVWRQIYPLKGQEGALGLDLLGDPRRRDEYQALVRSRQPSWSEPFALVEGGLGIVYRLPLYQADGRFTGLIEVMLKLPQALDSLSTFSVSPYLYQVSIGHAPEALKTAYQSPGWRSEGDATLSRLRTPYRVQPDSEAPPGMAQGQQTAYGQDSGADLWLDVSVQAAASSAATLLPARIQALLGLALLLGSAAGTVIRLRGIRQAELARGIELGQLQQVMDKSVISKLLFDASGRCFWANREACQILQLLPPALRDFNLLEHPAARRQGWDLAARAVLADGQTRQLDVQGDWGQGLTLDLRLTLDCLELGGQPVLLAQLLDLSREHGQQRELQRQRDNLALAQQASGLGYFEYLPAQRATRWDASAAAILGYPGQAQGKTIPTSQLVGFIHPEDLPGLYEPWQQTAQAQQYITQRYRLYWPDGSLHWVEINCYLERNESGKVAVSRGFIKDISADKQRETELVQAREAALASAHAKSEFLATMSHEIRTPMNGVLGYLELLQDQAQHLPAASREHLRHAAQSATLLRALLDDVLDFSKIEAGKLSLAAEPLRLGPLARDVAALMRGQLGSKPVTLQQSIDPRLDELVLQGDALRLRQVLMNLAGNAIKFTERGQIGLAIQLEAVDGSRARLRVEVSDTGIGMSAEQVQRLFQPFTQADGSITRRFGGTGLGLSISQSLLQLMGSAGLQVSSQPGAGSVFSFELELAVLDAAAQAQASPQGLEIGPDTLMGVQVLLVEDNPTNIALAATVLEGMGAQVSIATDGQQALDLLAELGPDFDLVLMDMQMPVMDGLAATRAIRAHPDWARLPVVAMTANAYEADRQACLDAGMNDFLTKPLERQRLAEVILGLQPRCLETGGAVK